MRNPVLTIVLVLLALIPIVVWGYTAYGTALSYQMADAGSRRMGYAAGILILILVGLTPGFVGGILMVVGAFLLGRNPFGARVLATIGLVLIVLTGAVFVAFEGPASGHEMMISGAVYVLLHVGVLVWLWRGWRRPAV
jgi:hypothetical protein